MDQTPLSDAKSRLAAEVDGRADVLLDVSRRIHAQPELGYEEHFAHDLLTGVLKDAGLAVTRAARGVDTAFEARAGGIGPLVAVVCEYDALPGIGHACGHNVIAAAGLGAGLAAAALAEELGGQVLVVGTPAEEGGGGKVRLIDGGTFKGVDAALMVHPADADLTAMDVVALQQAHVTYTGEAAHAAAFPHRGRNALDAAVLGYLNVAALRQHIAAGERLHGIITDGGDRPNIVPAYARTEWIVRSPTVAGLEVLKTRFLACLEAGATAAGCEMDLEWIDPVYADMIDSQAIVERYRANAEALGRIVRVPSPQARVVGSTDMGNVSYVVPSIHPMIRVAPPGVPIHTPAFAGFAGGPEGDAAVLDGAKALAFTVADLWLDGGLVERAQGEWREAVAGRSGAVAGGA
ncbi:MAG TPA: M20 family metallopeptidase [Acidimicrobiales bacterium]|nr:M20 family metallopeptidase [Acidimicrobiales bacterium]